MKVFISRDIPETGIDLMKKNGLDVTVFQEDRPMGQNELIATCKDYDALVCMFSDKIDSYFLNECKHLKVIAQLAVGYNNIDIAVATKLKIPIGYTPKVLSGATADIAFILMLAVSRNIIQLNKVVSQGKWDFFRPKAYLGVELNNKTLGIYGLGRIGAEMAKRCKGAYNMEIIYHDVSRNQDAEKLLGARLVSFDELLRQSDVISVHCALTPETTGIFNKDAFSKMKKNSIFVNTARGPVHNEIDLTLALKNNIIWGAGLDVTNPEPMKPDNPLLNMDNVVILPHIGSASREARNKMSLMVAENVIEGLKGNKIPFVVNPEIYI